MEPCVVFGGHATGVAGVPADRLALQMVEFGGGDIADLTAGRRIFRQRSESS